MCLDLSREMVRFCMRGYKEYAEWELKSARALKDLGLWNKAGKDCVSYCEKRLKGWLEEKGLLGESLMRTHNLKALYRSVPEYCDDLYSKLAKINGYYFELVYPGDNAFDITEKDAEEALSICEELDIELEGKTDIGTWVNESDIFKPVRTFNKE